MSCDMESPYIVSNVDGLVNLLAQGYYSMSCTWRDGYTRCYGTYTTGITVQWGDGTASGISGDDQDIFCTWYSFQHQYANDGLYTIKVTVSMYSNISQTYSSLVYYVYNVRGKWVKWQADCGDTEWDANGTGCSWNGNYGICWHTNSFDLKISEVFNIVKSFGWAYTIMGMSVQALFDLWFGDNWEVGPIGTYYMPWTSNWSYWTSNQVSIWPWNWWWTNWAPGFTGPGRIGFDIEGVFHGVDDPLDQLDICNRNAGAANLQAGFHADITTVTVGYPINFIDDSVGAQKVLYSFGDGHNSSDRNPTHVYKKPGIYSVTQMCYYSSSYSTIPVMYTRERYITVYEPSERVDCGFVPVPSRWTIEKAMGAKFVYAEVGESITIYFDSSDCDVVAFWSGFAGQYDNEDMVIVQKPGFPNNWTLTISYPAPGWVYPYAVFSQSAGTKAGSFLWSAGIRIGSPEDAGDPPVDPPNPEEDEDDSDYPTPPPAYMHRYVRLTGSDWNDGLTWETAMKTWEAALKDIPDGGWLHVDYDDYRHQAPVVFDKNVIIVPQEDYREVGLYRNVILPGHGKSKWWWPW